jgi:fluoroacetyl-CoA thioesterase
MPSGGLRLGLRHSASLPIADGLTVPHVSDALPSFGDMPSVFATAYLVAFVEATCIDAVMPFLPAGHKTVGTYVDLSHVAATPPGMTVVADVELVEIEDRRLRFRVECRDDDDVISSGHHERHIIDVSRFNQRLKGKAERERR